MLLDCWGPPNTIYAIACYSVISYC